MQNFFFFLVSGNQSVYLMKYIYRVKFLLSIHDLFYLTTNILFPLYIIIKIMDKYIVEDKIK